MRFLDTPWKITNLLERLIMLPIVRIKFIINNIGWPSRSKYYGLPIIQKHHHSRIELGSGLQLRSTVRSNPLGPNHPVIICTWKANAELIIGRNFSMTGGTLCAAQKIVIGDNVAVGANSIIIDTDFHPLNPTSRNLNPQEGKTAPIVIEDNVFIGMNSIILKGVRLGCGSVIGAGSVVTRDVPSGMIAAGNPARLIGTIKKDID